MHSGDARVSIDDQDLRLQPETLKGATAADGQDDDKPFADITEFERYSFATAPDLGASLHSNAA